jgi:hypothetical protein
LLSGHKMTLKQWLANGWLKAHQSSAEEIGNLLGIVERDLKDASEGNVSSEANKGNGIGMRFWSL